MWTLYLASLLNLALGASLLTALLQSLTRLCPRPVGLALAALCYILGSLPMDGPLYMVRRFLPNFYIYQLTFSKTLPEEMVRTTLFVNMLYWAFWLSFLTFCGRLSSPRPRE